MLHLICESSGPFFKRSKKWQTSRAIGHLFILFFFLFSFFLWIKLGLFLLFLLAFVFFSLITHICFSLFESGFPRWLPPVANNGNTSGAPSQIRFITGVAGRDPACIRLMGRCETLPNGQFTL